jgi:hypothetical protein
MPWANRVICSRHKARKSELADISISCRNLGGRKVAVTSSLAKINSYTTAVFFEFLFLIFIVFSLLYQNIKNY